MKWRYRISGGQATVNVYMNGVLCGQLTFEAEEFNDIRIGLNVAGFVEFIQEP